VDQLQSAVSGTGVFDAHMAFVRSIAVVAVVVVVVVLVAVVVVVIVVVVVRWISCRVRCLVLECLTPTWRSSVL